MESNARRDEHAGSKYIGGRPLGATECAHILCSAAYQLQKTDKVQQSRGLLTIFFVLLAKEVSLVFQSHRASRILRCCCDVRNAEYGNPFL